jgi:hypothetical protein
LKSEINPGGGASGDAIAGEEATTERRSEARGTRRRRGELIESGTAGRRNTI